MDNFMRKNIGSRPKNIIKMFFFWGFQTLLHENASQFYCCCSDDAKTYRIVARFNLEEGKTKIKPQNGSQFLFTTSEVSRISRS